MATLWPSKTLALTSSPTESSRVAATPTPKKSTPSTGAESSWGSPARVPVLPVKWPPWSKFSPLMSLSMASQAKARSPTV